MNVFKKIVSYVTMAAVASTALILILMLFKIQLPEKYTLPVLLTIAGLAVGGFFAMSSLNIIEKNKVLGWISFSLIAVSIILIDIMVWCALGLLLNITLTFSFLSITFNVIVSFRLEFGKKYLVPQIILYILTIVLDVILTLNLFKVFPKGNGLGTTLFLVFLIIDVVGFIVLKILYKKHYSIETQNDNTITITKDEYNLLKEKADKYDELTKK